MSGFQFPPEDKGGKPNGYATLDSNTKIPIAQIPDGIASGDVNPLLNNGA